MNPKDYQLFKQYPLNGTATISTGEVPTPYHIYNGYGMFIGGLCDLGACRRLLQDESVVPVQTTDGHAVMGIWICNFTEASLGPHHELQFSFFVSNSEMEPIAPHPFCALSLMMTRPDVLMICHGLWNNTPEVVAYNRELLSLNARQTDSRIERDAHIVTFAFKDLASGKPIISGAVIDPQKASARATFVLMSRIGVGRSMTITQQPWLSMHITNPVGVLLNRNAVAETFTKNDVNIVRYFESSTDVLTFGDTPYGSLQFTPHFVQYMDGFKFVYLHPK